MSWHDFYYNTSELNHAGDSFADEFPEDPDAIEYEDEGQDVTQIIRDPAIALSRMHPNQIRSDPVGRRVIDEAEGWTTIENVDQIESQIDDYLANYRRAATVGRMRIPALSENMMSEQQRAVMSLCREQYMDTHHFRKRVIVQGKAGTGKSALIKSIGQHLDSQEPHSKSYEILAPTGAAAFNIDGTTIHSGLRIPINGNMSPLNGENLRNLQLHFQKIRFIIIDEYSMVRTRLLYKIHRRLCEAKGNSQEPFGGLNVYLFGDIRQSPPVKDSAIYMHSNSVDSNLGSNLVSSIQRVFILTECHRQSSDQIEFREILDTIADGTVTPSGWELLMSRRMSILPRCISEFQDAVQLFPTNLQVDDHN